MNPIRLIRHSLLIAVLLVLLTAALALGDTSSPVLEPGMHGLIVQTKTAVHSTVTLWVILPEDTGKKIGCVIIAPAGTPEIWGSELGNTEEYYPYVRAGFAVVAYSLDGPAPDDRNSQDLATMAASHAAFARAGAGVADAGAAIDYIVHHVPQVDPKRIYSAGHSSAGTVALLVAAKDRRIRGCLAYCPPTDLMAEHADEISALQDVMPDISVFCTKNSPSTNVKRITCPVFLFTSLADTVVSPGYVYRFDKILKRTNSRVTFACVRDGGHYEAMINDGVPRGIEWLKIVDAKLKSQK
ncbi:hypothetical protein CCAX7_44790 [Capsulimonas corticalis]|uniref:Peptidase S9 prolyl oligopeptidase catalytic domain-containing protein n=1 Tax=Capsulimonas corticalis TaxID=2219043 RepID=A0A9N7L586_9BACT|nr:prolyl oligopeptidase family serine peptidase [Capsulimonas corticalis]BDI32428.1 hypothetical protein CCAX7_44790 [Capsulimonas corticalis]